MLDEYPSRINFVVCLNHFDVDQRTIVPHRQLTEVTHHSNGGFYFFVINRSCVSCISFWTNVCLKKLSLIHRCCFLKIWQGQQNQKKKLTTWRWMTCPDKYWLRRNLLFNRKTSDGLQVIIVQRNTYNVALINPDTQEKASIISTLYKSSSSTTSST